MNNVDQRKLQTYMEALWTDLCPPAITHRSSYFASPSDAKGDQWAVYDANCTYFRMHPNRRLLLCEATMGEFDYTPQRIICGAEKYPDLKLQKVAKPNDVMRKVYKHIPRLFVLVVQIAPGFHIVSAIYRGNCFWAEHDEEARYVADSKSDADLLPILEEIRKREGFDLEAWKAFNELYIKAAIAASTIAPSKNIHLN